MASIFSKIVRGEIPSYKVAETDKYYAFLDIAPLQKGHTLVVPKREEDYIFDLTDEELAGLMVFAKKVANAIRKTVPCERVGVAVIGLDVPHAHVHLVPLNGGNDLNFSNPKKEFSKEEMQACAAEIAANM
ncbi:HIT family protein [Odoribacter lunatus]|uniref:HIT family protein n=1 Tax=Odoribacter lunatus TaxID=2941335 RepID=UPI0020422A4F|nr:HIT family protein [Odoribacter lunatus]